MLPCNQGNNQNLRIVINALYKFFLSYDEFCKKTMFTIGLSKTITSHNIWISNDISKGEVLILIPTKKQEESVDTWKTKRKKERKKNTTAFLSKPTNRHQDGMPIDMGKMDQDLLSVFPLKWYLLVPAE